MVNVVHVDWSMTSTLSEPLTAVRFKVIERAAVLIRWVTLAKFISAQAAQWVPVNTHDHTDNVDNLNHNSLEISPRILDWSFGITET